MVSERAKCTDTPSRATRVTSLAKVVSCATICRVGDNAKLAEGWLVLAEDAELTELTVSFSVAISPSTLMSIVKLRLPCESSMVAGQRASPPEGNWDERETYPSDGGGDRSDGSHLIRQV